MLVHPDKNGGNEKAEEAFKRLQNAYEVSCIHLVAFESWVFWQLQNVCGRYKQFYQGYSAFG
jgi:hypothetical protein